MWQLQQAKASFSEMVRRVKDGPQTVTVHGKPSVVVVSADDFERMQPQSGSDLIELMARAPLDDLKLPDRGRPMPVRKVDL